MARDLADRFWPKVKKSAGCWNWTASVTRFGYGRISTRGGKSIRAHRASWEIANGPIPAGSLVLHRCDNPRCVNPAHLWLGTEADNMADKVAKGRQARGPAMAAVCAAKSQARGVRCPQSKLNDAKVGEVRALRRAGATLQEIANRFAIDVTTVHDVVMGRSWKHVPES